MHRPTLGRITRQLLLAPALAGLLASVPAASVLPPALTGVVGAGQAYAQGGMDLGILSPSFRDLPASLKPGQEFTITAATAPGARCAGWIIFRNQPPIALDSQPAPSGACSWSVTVPPTARAGTANIGIEITRSGQNWALYGITYVGWVGEQR
jgi:hypothetical protein